MKLKKTWIGICVFVIYTVGIIFATGVTGFISGLFPVYDKRMVTALIVAALAVIALVVSAVGITIGKALNKNSGSDIKWAPEIILPIILFIAGGCVYTWYINGIMPITGDMKLFESALVTKDGVKAVPGSILGSFYVSGLNIFMSFLGNELKSVLIYQLVLRMIMLIALYFALRNSIGIFGALAGSIATVAIPLFGLSIKHVYAGNMFFALVMLDAMLVVLFAKSVSISDSIKPYHVILGILTGALTGFAVYVDLAAVAVIVCMIAALFSDEEEFSFKSAVVDVIIFILAGLITFGCSVYFIGGMRPFYVSFFEYANRFYGMNNSAWFASVSASWWNLVISLGMLGGAIAVIFGFIFSKRNERIVPWLFFTVVSCVLSVVCGSTVINYDMYLFLMLSILVGCAVSCFAYKDKQPVVEKASATEAVKEPEAKEENEDKIAETVEPEDKDIREVVMPEENKENKENPRFVPEGMVLPTGDEDEENLVPNFNMNRPEMENIGILSVGKKEENTGWKVVCSEDDTEEPEATEITDEATEIADEAEMVVEAKKDDFDISIDPDDDFDI
ncbi:hypothetical protein [Butyrivibrio sp. AE3006]|uniref:hypothetical protein n=1 Tax=Butyrivibrio sp. AE3006 TaxID=1280673 RepID=UPI00041F31F5|nr:hypothetical protein [Butyrivibrio sp. AE3006]